MLHRLKSAARSLPGHPCHSTPRSSSAQSYLKEMHTTGDPDGLSDNSTTAEPSVVESDFSCTFTRICVRACRGCVVCGGKGGGTRPAICWHHTCERAVTWARSSNEVCTLDVFIFHHRLHHIILQEKADGNRHTALVCTLQYNMRAYRLHAPLQTHLQLFQKRRRRSQRCCTRCGGHIPQPETPG